MYNGGYPSLLASWVYNGGYPFLLASLGVYIQVSLPTSLPGVYIQGYPSLLASLVYNGVYVSLLASLGVYMVVYATLPPWVCTSGCGILLYMPPYLAQGVVYPCTCLPT